MSSRDSFLVASRSSSQPDWEKLLMEWDNQQEDFIPDREQRFKTILDLLEAILSRRFATLDLGCGPGSLSARLLERFPRAKSVAVDYDPVVLTICKMALKRFQRRIIWVEADLGGKQLAKVLEPFKPFDAAVSTTALHWLYPHQLRLLYNNLGKVIRRGGVFVNGDRMPWDSNRRRLLQIAERVKSLRGSGGNQMWHGWNKWWNDLQGDAYFNELFRIRKTRFPEIHSKANALSFEFHRKTLIDAGFRDVDVIWQDLDERIFVAIK